MNNPSLRSQPRADVAPAMEPRKDASIIDWLEESGRFMEPEDQEPKTDRDDTEEVSALLGDDFNLDEDDDSGED